MLQFVIMEDIKRLLTKYSKNSDLDLFLQFSADLRCHKSNKHSFFIPLYPKSNLKVTLTQN